MEKTIIALDNLSASNLPELQGFKEKQTQLVAECPYVEIIDNQTYELAKKHRTALLKGRTTLESQDKLIASKLTAFRKEVANVTKELIDITLLHEEKQQAEVKRYEAIKEAEKAEKERLENERIEKIKNKVSELETSAYEVIKSFTFQGLETDYHFLEEILNTNFDFAEYDILWTQAKNRIEEASKIRENELQEKENQRIENERLAREKAEADAKLEAIQKQQEKERFEREEKEREEKEKVFEVRKNRLAEIGVFEVNNENQMSKLDFIFRDNDKVFEKSAETIYNADVIDFENILTDAKKEIQEAKERKDLEKINFRKNILIELGFEYKENETFCFDNDIFRMTKGALLDGGSDWFESQVKDIKLQIQKNNEKAELETKKKAEKENKERQKRLKTDKAIIKNGLEIYFGELDLFTENAETKEFIDYANNEIQKLKNHLLTSIENL